MHRVHQWVSIHSFDDSFKNSTRDMNSQGERLKAVKLATVETGRTSTSRLTSVLTRNPRVDYFNCDVSMTN